MERADRTDARGADGVVVGGGGEERRGEENGSHSSWIWLGVGEWWVEG